MKAHVYVPPPPEAIRDRAGKVHLLVRPVIAWRPTRNHQICYITVNYTDPGTDQWHLWTCESIGFQEVDGLKMARPDYLLIGAETPFEFFFFKLNQDATSCILKEGSEGQGVELDAPVALVRYLISECHRHTLDYS